MRVYEIAKKYKTENKKFLEILNSLGIEGKKSISGLSEEEIKKVQAYYSGKKQPAKIKVPAKKPSAKHPPIPKPKTVKKKPAQKKLKPSPDIEKDVKVKPVPAKEKLKAPTDIKKDVAVKPGPAQKKLEETDQKKEVLLLGTENIKQLADKLNVSTTEIIKFFFSGGLPVTINQSPGKEGIRNLCESLGLRAEFKKTESPVVPEKEDDKEIRLVDRSAVVTIMGHVDHGKTTILDTIRKSRVAAKEHGQITQKIGAYKFHIKGKGDIVFLDTPGHEAFTSMRARGAKITDIVILVVAADEGIKPQTVEAVHHAKAAKVPIIVAVNKIDKPNINTDRVKQQLSEHELIPEDWGGETVFVNVSGTTGEGIPDLLEMVLLTGEMLELKAADKDRASGVVIESHMDKNKGPIITVLVQEGTLKRGAPFFAGSTFGNVRAMFDDWANKLEQAGPSTPVEILGANSITEPGERFIVVETEKTARRFSEEFKAGKTEKQADIKKVTLQDLYDEVKKGDIKDLKLILKTDYAGTIDAIKNVIEKLPSDEVKISVIHSEAGPVSESDILLASAANAVVLGFNVSLTQKVSELAKREGVEVRLYKTIYELADEVKKAVEGMLAPEEQEVLIGQAQVKQVFNLSDNTTVAGCMVVDGKILRNAFGKVIRGTGIIAEGGISSLKRFKENVKEVKQNMECGIGVSGFSDFREGDIIQCYTKTKVAKTL